MLVHTLADGPPERDLVVRVDHRVVRQDAPANVDGYERRDDRADAALRDAFLPVDARPSAGAVVVVPAPGDARPEETILNRQVAEMQRLEDDIFHASHPVLAQPAR